MIKMRPYAPPDRIAIRADSIDEEISDDIEDDVFIRDGKSSKHNEEKGLKRPLMAPRRKNSKSGSSSPIMKKRRRCWKCCEPFCYGLAALTILIILILLAAFILTLFPIPLQKIKIWLKRDQSMMGYQMDNNYEILGTEFVPCTQISVQRVWSRTFPRMNSESPARKVDLNGDGILDFVFGYGIALFPGTVFVPYLINIIVQFKLDESIQYEDVPLPKCTSVHKDEEVYCEGGIIALNGITGEPLWQRWAIGNVFSLYCTVDIDLDGYFDCIAAGSKGLIFAVNGRNGNVIWNFSEPDFETNIPILNDLYTINPVRDLNGDEIPDILAAHVEERKSSRSGHIKIISGKSGKVIRSILTPFREEVFVPLQIVTKPDGTELLLIITGGQNTPGGIYSIRLLSLMQYTSEKQFTPLYQTSNSGFMVPAVLADINQDQILDIIVSSFNSTVYAFDGRNYSMLWNYTFPTSESVSSIVPGHFDHDNVTDFMIKYNTGPGFPVYYYSQTIILNGLNGQPILDSMMTDSGGPSSLLGGVSISQTFGGDFFLHWQVQCRGKYDAKDAYQFIPDSDINQQARADICLLRYNTSTVLKLYAIARHVEPPGAVIFSSDDLTVRLNLTENRQLTQQNVSPLKHPKMSKKLKNKDYIASDSQPIAPVTHNSNGEIKQNRDNDPVIRKPMKILRFPNPLQQQQQSLPQETDRIIYDQVKPYLYMPMNNQPEREFKDYDIEQRNQDPDYDVLYGDDQQQQNERPIRLRSKYPINRGVRSDFVVDYDNNRLLNETTTELPISEEKTKMNTNEQPLNLWDLEMEKEEEEAIKETHKFDYTERHRRQEQEDIVQPPPPSPPSSSSSSSLPPPIKDETGDHFLAAISSTGILLPSLDKSNSSIDFGFILNVRESETYPPLFLQQDENCLEDKLSAYRNSYVNEELINLEKEFIKECLQSRLEDFATPAVPKFESQIVITRISITCTCGNLQQGEVCSKLEDFEHQRWTEYMGNYGSGVYRN